MEREDHIFCNIYQIKVRLFGQITLEYIFLYWHVGIMYKAESEALLTRMYSWNFLCSIITLCA